MKTLLEILDLTNEPNIINDIIDKHIKMESKHVPTPWEVSNKVKRYGIPLIEIISNHVENGISLSIAGAVAFIPGHHEEAEATAAHIVTCVNSHEELVKALQDILTDWSERMHNETEEFKPENDIRPGYWSPASSLVSSKIIAQARAVLKKVTDTPIEKQPK